MMFALKIFEMMRNFVTSLCFEIAETPTGQLSYWFKLFWNLALVLIFLSIWLIAIYIVAFYVFALMANGKGEFIGIKRITPIYAVLIFGAAIYTLQDYIQWRLKNRADRKAKELEERGITLEDLKKMK